MRGRVLTVRRTSDYGFIRAEDGRDHFFHASALVNGAPIEEMGVGDYVLFEPTMTARGPAALSVQRATLEGVIVTVQRGGGRGNGWGFLRPAEGRPDRFFHFSQMAALGLPAGELFAQLRVGMRVQYREAPGDRGGRARAVAVMPSPALSGPSRTEAETEAQAEADRQAPRCAGTITRLGTRGFGWITAHGADDDRYFHARHVAGGRYDSLQLGQQVDYIEETEATGRLRAVAVRPLDLDPATGDELRPPTAAGAGDDDDDNVYTWGEAS